MPIRGASVSVRAMPDRTAKLVFTSTVGACIPPGSDSRNSSFSSMLLNDGPATTENDVSARAGPNVNNMKKTTKKTEPDLAPEYDFSAGVRGKYARRYAQGSNVVVLEPDVARSFSNADDVNRALRALAGIIRMQKGKA